MEVRPLRDAILCAAGAGKAFAVCALLDLREFGFADDCAGVCGWGAGGIVEVAAGSGAAMRALPA